MDFAQFQALLNYIQQSSQMLRQQGWPTGAPAPFTGVTRPPADFNPLSGGRGGFPQPQPLSAGSGSRGGGPKDLLGRSVLF